MTLSMLPMILLLVLFVINVPVAYCLMISTLSYFVCFNTGMPIQMVIQRMISGSESFPLMAVPFFILAGTIMTYSGISSHLMSFADVLTGHMRGGLGQVNVLLSALMGGVSGSGNADAAMQSKMLVPEMMRRGYDKGFSAAITAASAVITPIIPPGISLILFAFMADVSVGKMFLAGYVPGIMITAALMIAVSIISKKRGYLPSREKRASAREIWVEFKKSIWALFLPFGLIMGMRLGMFTASEAGAMTVIYTLIVGFFIYKELDIKHIPVILKESILSTCSVMLIIVAASAFGYYMSWERIPHMLSQILIGITDNPYVMLLIINVFLLMLGMFLEGTPTLIILTPLLVPVITSLGIDPIHFGIVMVVNITIGGVTPPFGTIMFMVCSVLKLRISEFIKELWPFLFALLAVLLLITFIPPLVTFLPNALM
ncbi:TRAP transporter large permease [Oscillospiraceae bacterium PP1C4]